MQKVHTRRRNTSALTWGSILVGVFFLGALGYMQRDWVLHGRNDFVAFYTGAKLAGTSGLYDRAANLAVIREALGVTLEGVTYIRPPFYASLLKPLAYLPYMGAYTLYELATFSCALWFIVYFSKECKELPVFAAMGLPILVPLCNGQDTPFLLAAVGAVILLLRKEKDFLAGLVLSFCAIKFHLFPFVVGLVLLKKRWRLLYGGAVGTAALTTFGAIVAGPESLLQWIQVLRDPWITPGPEGLPNIHGLVLTFGGDVRVEFLLAAIVGVAFLWMTRQTENFELLLAASLVCGLLTSFHSGTADDILLFPVFVLTLKAAAEPALRVVSAFLLMPIPYFFVFVGSPYSIVLPVALFAWMITAALALRQKSARSERHASELPPSAEYRADNA
ncbi:MAG: glycosyltransferase family 87 protein [Bryobacteraceae bacterium]